MSFLSYFGGKMDYDFELYKIIVDLTKRLDDRWDMNFRALLTVNSILIAAVAVIINGILKYEISCRYWFIPFAFIPLCGIIITRVGYQLLERIDIDDRLRYTELRFLEKKRNGKLQLKPFTNGYEFFLKKPRFLPCLLRDIEGAPDPCEIPKKSRAIVVYKRICWFFMWCTDFLLSAS